MYGSGFLGRKKYRLKPKSKDLAFATGKPPPPLRGVNSLIANHLYNDIFQMQVIR
jgi:hypothetical protein